MSEKRYTWLAIGTVSALALYTAYRQLETYKQRCAMNSSETKNFGVEQVNEDGGKARLDSARQLRLMREASLAIKLETLQVLARGVNPDLRNAALKIVTERALRENSLNHLLSEISSDDAASRLRGLLALRIITQNTSPKRLLQPPIFKALVTSLRKSQPSVQNTTTAHRCEHEAISILTRLIIPLEAGNQMAVDAGVVDWLKEYTVPGYPNVIVAVFDPERFDDNDSVFQDLLSALYEEGTPGRTILQETGMVHDIRRGRGENEEWVEVEIGEPVAVGRRRLREGDLIESEYSSSLFPMQDDFTFPSVRRRGTNEPEMSDEERRLLATEEDGARDTVDDRLLRNLIGDLADIEYS